MEFREWLFNEDAGSPGAKAALYPMGYGGIGLYPPSDMITWGADAIVYMPKDLRQLTFKWGRDMLSNPFPLDSLYQKIEGKKAGQIQVGNINPEGNTVKKEKEYISKVSLHTVQVGGLVADGKAFEKASSYVKKSDGKGLWDYTTFL